MAAAVGADVVAGEGGDGWPTSVPVMRLFPFGWLLGASLAVGRVRRRRPGSPRRVGGRRLRRTRGVCALGCAASSRCRQRTGCRRCRHEQDGHRRRVDCRGIPESSCRACRTTSRQRGSTGSPLMRVANSLNVSVSVGTSRSAYSCDTALLHRGAVVAYQCLSTERVAHASARVLLRDFTGLDAARVRCLVGAISLL
jgi:hypothetical protein